MEKIKKADLIRAIAAEANVSIKDAEAVFNATFNSIKKVLAAGDSVPVPDFGTFEVRERAARVGRNPATNETISIPASKVPAFKPAKGLKDVVNK